MQHLTNPWQSNCVPGNVPPLPVTINSLDPNGMNYGGLPPEVAPASTAVYATTSTFSWAHTVPSFMPWVTKAEANVQEPIVHFTAPFPPDPCTSHTATSWELMNNFGANQSNVNSHLKRKSDLEVIDTSPQKLCITEERMAARFREMHISNQYTVPSESSPFGPSGPPVECDSANKPVTNLNQLDYILKGTEDPFSSKSLVLAPELKKLIEPEKVFANTFLNKVERNPMALVLWQPPNNGLVRTNENLKENNTEEKEESSTNITSYLPPQLSTLCSQNLISNRSVEDPKSTSTFDYEMDT